MAKVSSATIKAVLITSRPKANGEYPIVIRVQFNGRAERYLPITCKKSEWDSQKGRCNSKCKSSNSHNRLIISELHKVETKLLDYQRLGIPYTAKDLLSDKNSLQNANSLIFKDLMERMLDMKGYENHTRRLYRYSYNSLVTFMGDRKDFKVIDLNSSLMEGFARYLKNVKGIADGTINTLLARIGCVYRYGIEMNIIDEVRFPHPFRKFNYWKTYKISSNRFGLTSDVMQLLENDYLNQVVYTNGIDGGTWWYKENVERLLLHKRSSELFIQCLFLICYKMQGLALCDMVRIKAENITIQKIENDEYYIFSDIFRKKTNEQINVISVKRTPSNAAIFDIFINSMSERDGYFLPLLNNKNAKPDNIVQAMSQMIGKKLNKIFTRIDKDNDNILTDMGLDYGHITFYQARHTFASVYVNEKHGNPIFLAQLMGRSVQNIFSYVNSLSNVQELIKAKSIVED